MHNTQKNIGDRAVITALIMVASIKFYGPNKSVAQLTPNVITAIKHTEPNFQEAKKQVDFRNFLIDPPDGLDNSIPYTQPETNIKGWCRQLTAALVWSVTGRFEPTINWDKALPWSPQYLESVGAIPTNEALSRLGEYQNLEEQFDKMRWELGWSATPRRYPPDIYTFDLCRLEEPDKWQNMNIVFRHSFYNKNFVWYVLFNAPKQIINSLMGTTDIEHRNFNLPSF